MTKTRAEDGQTGVAGPNGIDAANPDRAAEASPGAIVHVPPGGIVAVPPDAILKANGQVELKDYLHEQLLETVPADRLKRLSELELRLELAGLIAELSQRDPDSLELREPQALVDQVVDEVLGYGPLGSLMRQGDISEILINGPHQVFVERRGQLQFADVTFHDEDHLSQIIRRLIARTDRRIDKQTPMVDARLPDGSRVNVVLKPPALNGPLVSIRRFGVRPLTVEDLLAKDSLTKEMLDFLSACVKARLNIMISGGTGSGKTTLLNALSRFIPSTERMVTIEDTAELELQQPHLAKMEAQPADLDGEGEVTIRDLVRNALRMRPDRIIVGECRGGEALEMLQAMNTGHEGSMTTVHANTTREALTRVELMVTLAGFSVPVTAIRKLIASSIHMVIQVSRLPDGKRKIVTISEIAGMQEDTISMHDIFAFVQTGIDPTRGVEGHFQATGIRPHFLTKLDARGASVPFELFIGRRLQPQSSRGADR
jgi:pilus assembly protein CpaF